MKKVILKSLTLTNFKGEKNRTTDFNPVETTIAGENGLGKSRHFDAFMWLLFGKDKLGRKDYEIRTRVNGDLLHKVDCNVTGLLSVDGAPVKLSRSYVEDWVKPHGQIELVFKGNHTETQFNDVPCNVGEYQKKVNDIIDESAFKMLTNPMFFVNMKWQDQRNVLFQIAGTISDDEIASHKPEFKALLDCITGKTFDEYKMEIASKKKSYKDELTGIQPRIAQTQKLMPKEENIDDLNKQLETINQSIANKDSAIADATKSVRACADVLQQKQNKINELRRQLNVMVNDAQLSLDNKANESRRECDKIKSSIDDKNSEIATKKREIERLQKEITDCQQSIFDKCVKAINDYRTELSDKTNQSRREHDSLEKQQNNVAGDIDTLEKRIERLKKDISDGESDKSKKENELQSLRDEFKSVRDEKQSEECPHCHQRLPQSMIDDEKVNFNANKIARCNEINVKGQSLSKTISDIQEEIKANQSKLADAEKELTTKRDELKALQSELATKNDVSTNVETPEMIQAGNKIKEMQEHRDDATGIFIEFARRNAIGCTFIDDMNNFISDAKKSLKTAENDLLTLNADFKELTTKDSQTNIINAYKLQPEMVDGTKPLMDEIAELEKAVENAPTDSVDTSAIEMEKKALQQQRDDLMSRINLQDTIAKYQQEIDELEANAKFIAQKIADLERTEYTMQQFTKTKIEECESRINNMFSFVTFRLFDYTIDGNESETCVPLINGVPFGAGNTAGQVNAGLDIINALCKYYGICAPIFIDNRESVNRLLDTNSQIINLVVTDDKELIIK